MISREQAIEIAQRHYGEGFELFKITHGVPDTCSFYRNDGWVPDNVWCVCCSACQGNHFVLGPSRAIVISKDTGEILYNGSACDEG